MSEQNYYTAYDKDGNLIKYQNINDVPIGKQGGALTVKRQCKKSKP